MTGAQDQGLTGADFAELARQAKTAGPEMMKRFGKVARAGGQDAVRAAKTSGARFSTRFPGAVGLQVKTTGKSAGVLVTMSRKKAPHGRAFENDDRPGSFEHPVFGDEQVVVEQDAHPWFFSSIRPVAEQTASNIERELDEFFRDIDFT